MALGANLVTDSSFESNDPAWEWLGTGSRQYTGTPLGTGVHQYYARGNAAGAPSVFVRQALTVNYGVLYQIDFNHYEIEVSEIQVRLGVNLIGSTTTEGAPPWQGSFLSNLNMDILVAGQPGKLVGVDNVFVREVLPDSPLSLVDGGLTAETLINRGLVI